MRSRPAGGGGGRVCRGGERGEESPGEGGTEPRLRARQVGARPGLSGAPSPPGTATSSAGWTREEGGGCGEGTNAEGTVGGFGGSLTASPGAVGPHVPQKPLRLLLPLLFCLRRRRLPRVPLPPPPPADRYGSGESKKGKGLSTVCRLDWAQGLGPRRRQNTPASLEWGQCPTWPPTHQSLARPAVQPKPRAAQRAGPSPQSGPALVFLNTPSPPSPRAPHTAQEPNQTPAHPRPKALPSPRPSVHQADL